jgi:pantetheine-phosphate adenylyltransferase
VKLIYPILYPTVIPYPWPDVSRGEHRRDDKRKTVVLAGSFNPPHRGHLAMLLYLAERYGRVIVVVGVNPAKHYRVTGHQRADLIRDMLQQEAGAKNVEVQVVSGYIWRTVKPQGARIFIRGIRSWEKDGKEERSLQILNTWGPLVLGPLWWPLPTIYLEGKPEFNHVSSTLIRKICQSRGGTQEELKTLVPGSIAESVAQYYGKDA